MRYFDAYADNPRTGKQWCFEVAEDQIKVIDGKQWVNYSMWELWEVKRIEDVTERVMASCGYFEHFGTACE